MKGCVCACFMCLILLSEPGSVLASRRQQATIFKGSEDTAFGEMTMQEVHRDQIFTASENTGFENMTMEKEESEWCNPFSKWSPTSYYFQEPEPDGNMTAYTLEVNKASLQILVHKGQEWELVKNEGSIQWVITGDSEDQPMDFLENVRYIKFMPEILRDDEVYVADSLVFHYNSGHKKVLKGSYLPRALLENRLKSMTVTELEDLNTQVAKISPGKQGAKAFRKTVGTSIVGGAVGGAAVGAPAGVYLTAVLAGAFHNTASLTTVLYNAAFFMGFGAAAGAVALGGVGIAVGSWALIHNVIKARRELHLSAAEKIFNSIKCHKTMTKCSSDILVPKSDAAEDICREASKTT